MTVVPIAPPETPGQEEKDAVHRSTAARAALAALVATVLLAAAGRAAEGPPAPTTWDGRFPVDTIRATVVYFLPADREAIPDWQERVAWLCERLRRFHAREFAGGSRLLTTIHPQPFRSALQIGRAHV